MLGTLASLIPTPLHPAVVHLPMALAVLVPVFAVGAVIAVRRGAAPMRSWSLAVGMMLPLSASAWFSIETGEDQEDRVENVVPKASLHDHERAADNFLWLSVGVLAVAGVGLFRTKVAAPARLLATGGTVLLVVAGYRVGHSGGELVYAHGAAAAYVAGAPPAAGTSAHGAASNAAGAGAGDDDDNDDDGY